MKRIITLYLILLSTSLVAQNANISLVANWHDPMIVPRPDGQFYNDIWGYAQNGKEYAIIGTTQGAKLLDITNASNPQMLFDLPGTKGNIVHRDYHTFKNYLYAVSDEDPHGLYIYDLQYLPDSCPRIFDDTLMFKETHNVFVDTAGYKLYAIGADTAAMVVMNILQPDSPTVLHYFTEEAYVHDAYIERDTAYLNCGNSGLFVYRFTNVTAPVLIGSLTTYEDQGYNHAGWRSQNAATYVLADETHGMKLKIINDSDLFNIEVKKVLGSEKSATSIPHNVMITGDYAYISYYYDGLYIINIQDPENAFFCGSFDTYFGADDSGYQGAWGIYSLLPSGNILVSDMQSGLYIFDATEAYTVTASVADFDKSYRSKISVGPNPVGDVATFDFDLNDEHSYELILYDVRGKVVSKQKITSGKRQLDFSFYNSGTYFYHVKSSNGTIFGGKVLKR